MNEYLENRAVQIGDFIVKNNATVRQTAKVFGISKSTVHKDVSSRLWWIDRDLFYSVKKVLEKNMKERHIRGGEATKIKYRKTQRLEKVTY